MPLPNYGTDIANAEKVNLLILERSTHDLTTQTDADGSVILEGVFTQIGVKNKNNRIYEEKEVMPHINELKEKIKTSKLLGELDHPKDFDISLSNVSHVIESLDYNPQTKQVIGRIRLLNTTKGKEAQALVKDGIPLHISSRAAGTVDENNKVKIKKWFTYDLVADPGFANAELSRVNESFGFDDDNLVIYRLEESYEKEKEKETNSTMNETEFVKSEDFNKYTEYLGAEIKKLKESANKEEDNTTNEMLEKLVKYSETIAERVNQLTEYSNHLAENLNSSIAHGDYVVERVNEIKKYASYLGEELNTSIGYSESLAESVDNGIKYSEVIANKLNQSIAHSDHIAEKLEQTIKYANHISEGNNNIIDYTDFLREHIENGIGYTEHIATKINEGFVPSKSNDVNESAKALNEAAESTVQTYKDSISESLNALIESAKTRKTQPSGETHFINFLSESKKEQYDSLDESVKANVINAMALGKPAGTIAVENILESVINPVKQKLNFVDDMPEKYKSKWENLSESRQEQIIAESKFYPLNTSYQINNFWQTRDLRTSQVQLEKLNESKEIKETNETNPYSVSDEFRANLIAKVKGNLGKY